MVVQRQPPELKLISEPVGATELVSALPALKTLSPTALAVVESATNIIEAPCPPCADESLARCAVKAPAGCENLPGLMARAAHLASAGAAVDKVQLSVAYGDDWYAIPEDRPLRPDPKAPVRVDLFVDPSSRWLGPTVEAAAVVGAGQAGVVWRFFAEPAGDAAPPAEALALAAGAEAAAQLGAPEAYLQALLRLRADPAVPASALPSAAAAAAGLDAKAWEAALGPAMRAIVEQAALRERLRVRATPTWFVDGYRLAGLQSPESIGGAVGRELEDLQFATVPPARLAGGVRP